MESLFTTVGLMPKLKAEVRLAQAISEFSGSLTAEKDRVRFKNLQSQSPPGSDEIIKLTEEINRDGARLHRSWRPYGTRLVAILERIRQFAPIGDVLIGGSQNLITCGTSLSFLSYFENVTSMMLNISRSLSLHNDFSILFPGCQKLQTYMCEYTIVIVQVCAKVVANCSRSFVSQLASSLATSFDSIFKPLQSELTTWGQMIEKRTTVLLAQASLKNQDTLLDRLNSLRTKTAQDQEKVQRQDRKNKLLTALCPIQSEVNLIWRRERKKGTSTWIDNHVMYQNWLKARTSSVVWLTGNLGSGKTVTMASVVAQCMMEKVTSTVSFFFCQARNPKTLLASALLGSIVTQVLDSPAMESSLASFLESTEVSANICAKLEGYFDILLKVTPSDWRGIFILDGIDECSLEEVEDISSQLQRLLSLRKSVDRSDDIRGFIMAEIARWSKIRQLPSDLKELAKEQLLAGCQGMFLWLSLEVEDICPKYSQDLRSDAEILTILENLPKSLPEAFDRALTRIEDHSVGSKIFKLVAAAERSLTADELRVASSIKPGNKVWRPSLLIRSAKTLLSRYGGSLLDLDEEDSGIRFIHYSVLLHLTEAPVDPRAAAFHFDLSEAQIMMGSVCVTYLNISIFETRVSNAQRVSFGQVPERTAESVTSNRLSRNAWTVLKRHSRQADIKVDLEKLSHDLCSQKWEDESEAYVFLEYAKKHWLSATRDILGNVEHNVYVLWTCLIAGLTVLVSLPWDAAAVSEAATWAFMNDHRSLFQFFLHSDNQKDVNDALAAAEKCVENGNWDRLLRGDDLGLLVPLYLTSTRVNLVALKAFIDLGCQPLIPEGSILERNNRKAQFGLLESVKSTMVNALRGSTPDDAVLFTVVPFLLNYLSGPDEVIDGEWTILHMCIQHRHKLLAGYFLSMKANIDGCLLSGKPTPLQLALKLGEAELAERLLGARPNILGNPDGLLPPMLLALEIPDLKLFHNLFSRGAHESKIMFTDGTHLYTAFKYACWLFCRDSYSPPDYAYTVLKAFHADGSDINLRYSGGETPLVLSIRTKTYPLTRTLLELGADPNITTPGGLSPLMVAAYCGVPELVDSLLDSGADINLRMTGAISKADARILSNTDVDFRKEHNFVDDHWPDSITGGWSALTLSLMALIKITRKVLVAKQVLDRDKATKKADDEEYQESYRMFALLSNECRPLGFIVKALLTRGAKRLPCDEQVAKMLGIEKFSEASYDKILAALERQGVRTSWR
ncbi:NACHT domain-containing protein [Fusarium austroafricanum]|uniref:NACHT domain-containing protein n=1 Tax=Fusarium austroafricanum TaxID=2364996 RepID=A0A8H4K7M7_9HYPO|nr:NACHT domain-containing protein [Fusarium austroafricanum]